MDEHPDEHKTAHTAADQRLRVAAIRTEHIKPLEERLADAADLLLQLRGLAAGGHPIPAALDQQLFGWLHGHAVARKGDGK
jgi:hypothetical protein